MIPSYLNRLSIDELKERAEKLYVLLDECKLCPNVCLAKRREGETGDCYSTEEVVISSVSPHFGEEAPLVGMKGSGTIFFTSCNLSCQFCQNYDISQLHHGHVVTLNDIAKAMLHLQSIGCHNINFVTPTHFSPQIIKSLILAINGGLNIPLVYNCGGFESIRTLKLLQDIIDIYMPDIKYGDDEIGEKYSKIKNYWKVVQGAVKEMQRQVGDLQINDLGIAERGLIIRHLVLPNRIAGSEKILDFISSEISKNAYVNIMEQYYPSYNAGKFEELNRRITVDEYEEVLFYAKNIGLNRATNH